MEVLAIAATSITLISAILWLIIGWRAMRAHEKLAEHQKLQTKAVTYYVNSKLGKK